MGSQPQTAALSWLRPESLADLIAALREAGYSVDVSHSIAAQDLILALVARGERLDAPQRLKSLLGPLLCTSPTEQYEFGKHFDHWAETQRGRGVAPESGERARALEKELNAVEGFSSLLWTAIAIALIVAVVIAILVFRVVELPNPIVIPQPDGTNPPPPPPPQVPDWILPVLVAAPILALASFAVWRIGLRLRASRFLMRRSTSETPEINRVSVRGVDESIFSRVMLFRIAQDFRRRRSVPARDLDVSRTLDESLRRAGWFSPVYGSRQILPEYLVLIDRATFKDHQARLAANLLERLRNNGVLISVYYFDGNPRLSFLEQRGTPFTISQLADRHAHDRLIIFSDVDSLLSSSTGELEAWTELFKHWTNRAVMTPQPRREWGLREQEVSREFLVLPATPEGMGEMIESVRRGSPLYRPYIESGVSYPTELQLRPRRWIQRDPLDDALVIPVLTELRAYMGEPGFYWLSACAIYPAIHWNLTLYLGSSLRDPSGAPLLQLQRLTDLSRLPWFRYGYMPDWLRLRLIAMLPAEQEIAVRQALQTLLVAAVQGPVNDFELEIARSHETAITQFARPLLRLLGQSAPPASPLREHVFQTFMAGERQKLAVELPRTWRDIAERESGPERWKVGLAWVVAPVLGFLSSFGILFSLYPGLESAWLDAIGFRALPADIQNRLIFGLVGAGSGLVIGLGEWLVIRRFIFRLGFWLLSSIIGWSIAFVIVLGAIENLRFAGEYFIRLVFGMGIASAVAASAQWFGSRGGQKDIPFARWVIANTLYFATGFSVFFFIIALLPALPLDSWSLLVIFPLLMTLPGGWLASRLIPWALAAIPQSQTAPGFASTILGILTFRAATYRDIAKNENLTASAALIVVLTSLIVGFANLFPTLDLIASGFIDARDIRDGLIGAGVGVIFGVLGWVVCGWTCTFLARRGGSKTKRAEMLRVTGYAEIISLVGFVIVVLLIPQFSSTITDLVFAGVVFLRFIAYVIGIREAAEFSTIKAVGTAFGASVVLYLIYVVGYLLMNWLPDLFDSLGIFL